MFRKISSKNILTAEPQQSHETRLQQPSLSASSQLNNHNDADASSRPKIQVGPKGIGPVTDLHENDVLCGRGGRINGHFGNIQFRKICSERRDEYFTQGIKKIQKAHIAASVVEHVRSMDPPGRFLKQDGSSGQWFDIGCAKAMTKVGQAIREHTPKSEDDYAGDNMRQTQGRGSSQIVFNGPLYPDYSPIETQRSDQVPSRTVTLDSAFTPDAYQNTVANSYSNNYGDRNSSEYDLGRNFLPTAASRPTEKRLSTFSALSGLSRMSALMRESVQSNCSDGSMSMSPSRRMSGAESLLRQSVLSDISDCMSVMSLEDAGYRGSTVANNCLEAQENMDMGLVLSSSPLSQDKQLDARLVNDTTDLKDPQQSRWAGRQSRKFSILSPSMASTLSILSIGSATSFSLS